MNMATNKATLFQGFGNTTGDQSNSSCSWQFWCWVHWQRTYQTLPKAIEWHHKVVADWTGTWYYDITIDFDCTHSKVHLSMPRCIQKALKLFQHHNHQPQHSPFPCAPIMYGAKQQYATQASKVPLIKKLDKQCIWQVCCKFLSRSCYGPTLLCPISVIASQSAKPTQDTMNQTKQFLDYLASQENAVLA